MKLVVTSRDRRSAKEDLTDKMAATLALLQGRYPEDRFHLVAALVDVLATNTPVYYLAASSPGQLADWIQTLFTFIDGRTGAVAVSCTLPAGPDGTLLLTNCADASFLLHTIQLCLNQQHIHFRVVTHPLFRSTRSAGRISAISGPDGSGDLESLIVIELEKAPTEVLARLDQLIIEALNDVLVVAASKSEIEARLQVLSACDQCSPYADFFNWLNDDNASLFAYRCLRISPAASSGERRVKPEKGLTLGLARKLFVNYHAGAKKISDFNPRFQELLLRDEQVGIEVLERTSPILRNDRLIYIGARQVLPDGAWLEHGFIGLLSENALREQTLNVPVLRQKIEAALNLLGIPRGAHDYRKIIEILNTYPKIELFFMNQQELIETVQSFALLYRHGMVRVIPARGLAIRGVTLLLILPKGFYTDENLPRIESFLCRYFRVPEVLTRVIHLSPDYMSLHVNLQPEGDEVPVDLDRLERGLTQITQPWKVKLHQLLERTVGDEQGGLLWEKYRKAFSLDYQALVHPRFALRDVTNVEAVLSSGDEVIDLWGPFKGAEQFYRLQFYSQKETYLNDLMPFLENLNLCVIDEVDFTVDCADRPVFIKSFSVRNRDKRALSLSQVRPDLLATLLALRTGEVENDYLHHLLVLTGLSWRQIDVFRGYRNYYFQLGPPFTKKRVAFAFINHPEVALLLFRYFEARFAPRHEWESMSIREEQGLMPIRLALVQALETVADINEDQILRTFFNLIDSTVRTNFFKRCNQPDYFFAFKISAIGIIDMPAPRPLFEIYVHSNSMEGIHLRGGKVARGGIRWSDRPDDFRTEVLGLMKTQMTKNTVIVPVGSKGGFIVKTPYTTREEGSELSAEAYKRLMSGLLDLTDNRAGEAILPPEGVIAYDDPDPYLVVAADKGTAHLPDTANSVAQQYRFWLDDAFASGGSYGYDHKKLAITARGAWESVKRHFRELGVDIQNEPFSVIGIGDMSGDVFGNGMLLSQQIKLLAAFNHRHIFLDPTPDPARSFKERKRLFALPRSSWDDYNPKLISAGGGVWERSAKEIPLSAEVREWLGVRHESLDGQSLIRLLLAARADLLWNGGIGTYVKAAGETNEEAGDRTNDPVRIDAGQLQVRVVGEGGNLGMTQLARVEYALAGGRINTDAVDNSGGVDCSDHEVNLKILMGQLIKSGRVGSRPERDKILLGMTDEVCQDVLANNYSQSLCLSLDQLRCTRNIDPFIGLSDRLSRAGLLDRRGEFLPSSRDIRARSQHKLVKPELSILMAYSKMHLYQALLDSPLPAAPVAQEFLLAYFPDAVRERFGAELLQHPLAAEIIATVVTNRIVDHAGSAFVLDLAEKAGVAVETVARIYLLFDLALGAETIRQEIFSLDNRTPASRQYQLLLRLEDCLASLTADCLGSGRLPELQAAEIDRLRSELQHFASALATVLPADRWQGINQAQAELVALGLSAASAQILSVLDAYYDFLPVMQMTESSGNDLFSVFRTYLDVRQYLGLDAVTDLFTQLQLSGRWDRLAKQAISKRFKEIQLRLTRAVCLSADCNTNTYFSRHRNEIRQWQTLSQELQSTLPVNLHPFTVLAELLESIVAA